MVLEWLLQRPRWALLAALVVETIVFVVGQGDFVASDPLWYADLAHRISVSPADVFGAPSNHPFEMRVGLTLPLALLYKMFGVSVLVSDLPGLFSALGVLLVGYSAAPTPRAKLLALLFGLTSVSLVRYSSMLNIDLPCATLMACSILWLSRSDRPRGAAWIAGAVAMWFAAFLVKESAVWLAPVWLYAIVRDVRASGWRRTLVIYGPGLAVGAALAIGYLVVCARIWGDPLARFHGIHELTEDHDWTMIGRSAGEWLGRLTWQPIVLLVKMFGTTLVPVVLAPWLVTGRDRFWFGSSSLTAYAPLPLSPRMLLPALPGMVVVAALATDRALERTTTVSRRRAIVLALAAAVAIPAAISIAPFLNRPRPQQVAYAGLHAEVDRGDRPVVLVCDDGRCRAISELYFGFAVPPNLRILTVADLASTPRPPGALVRVMIYIPRGAHPTELETANVLVARMVELGFPPILETRDVLVYDAGDGARLWPASR